MSLVNILVGIGIISRHRSREQKLASRPRFFPSSDLERHACIGAIHFRILELTNSSKTPTAEAKEVSCESLLFHFNPIRRTLLGAELDAA